MPQCGLGGRAVFEAASLQLQQHGYVPRGGQIVDASQHRAAPIAQVRSAEREALNEGKTPKGWSTKRPQHTHRDARWITLCPKKHGKSFYGYRVHCNVDARSKLVRRVEVTPANIEDSKPWVPCSIPPTPVIG